MSELDDDLDGIAVEVALEDAATGARAPGVRVLNFHNTPARRADVYRRQLEAAAEGCGPADEDALLARLDGGGPDGDVLLPVLYEGYRNGYETVLPLVEALGLTAWCVVPTAFPDVPEAEQHAWALAHELGPSGPDDPARIAMTWDELRDVVARGHVVCCHTATHCGQADVDSAEAAAREVLEPARRLHAELGVRPRTAAFLWGAPAGTSARVDAALADAGFRLLISNTSIQGLPGRSS